MQNDKRDKQAEKKKNNVALTQILLFVLTAVFVSGGGYLYGASGTEILRLVLLSCLGAGGILFLLAMSRARHELDYANEEHPGRFLIAYLICLLLSFVLVVLPAAVWPFLPIFVTLSLFSNSKIGTLAGGLCLMLAVSVGNLHTTGDFCVYFICGCAGIALFQGLDDTYKVTSRIFISMLVLLIGLSVQYILIVNEMLSFQLFLLPLLNLIVSFLLLLIILKCFSGVEVLKYRVKYLEINDPECPLLVTLKEETREEFIRAIHTAYFCDRIAKRLLLDDEAARGGGFYHRIGLIKGENTEENIRLICEENHFPPALKALLLEYSNHERPLHSKEAAVLLFSDTIVMTIRSLFKKDPEAKPDYPLLIDAVFKRNNARGLLSQSDLSIRELNIIKKIFLEETLYYDFLR